MGCQASFVFIINKSTSWKLLLEPENYFMSLPSELWHNNMSRDPKRKKEEETIYHVSNVVVVKAPLLKEVELVGA